MEKPNFEVSTLIRECTLKTKERKKMVNFVRSSGPHMAAAAHSHPHPTHPCIYLTFASSDVAVLYVLFQRSKTLFGKQYVYIFSGLKILFSV